MAVEMSSVVLGQFVPSSLHNRAHVQPVSIQYLMDGEVLQEPDAEEEEVVEEEDRYMAIALAMLELLTHALVMHQPLRLSLWLVCPVVSAIGRLLACFLFSLCFAAFNPPCSVDHCQIIHAIFICFSP